MPTAQPVVVRLPNVRLSFPHIFNKQERDSGDAVFSASALLDPDDTSHARALDTLKKELNRVGKEKWPEDWGTKRLRLAGTCLKYQDEDLADGPLTTETTGKYREEYDGVYVVSANNTRRPEVRAKNKDLLTPEDEGEKGAPYSGCFVTMLVSIWAQDNKHGKRLNANLLGVQFKADGEAFSSAVTVGADDWDDDDDDDNDDGLM